MVSIGFRGVPVVSIQLLPSRGASDAKQQDGQPPPQQGLQKSKAHQGVVTTQAIQVCKAPGRGPLGQADGADGTKGGDTKGGGGVGNGTNGANGGGLSGRTGGGDGSGGYSCRSGRAEGPSKPPRRPRGTGARCGLGLALCMFPCAQSPPADDDAIDDAAPGSQQQLSPACALAPTPRASAAGLAPTLAPPLRRLASRRAAPPLPPPLRCPPSPHGGGGGPLSALGGLFSPAGGGFFSPRGAFTPRGILAPWSNAATPRAAAGVPAPHVVSVCRGGGASPPRGGDSSASPTRHAAGWSAAAAVAGALHLGQRSRSSVQASQPRARAVSYLDWRAGGRGSGACGAVSMGTGPSGSGSGGGSCAGSGGGGGGGGGCGEEPQRRYAQVVEVEVYHEMAARLENYRKARGGGAGGLITDACPGGDPSAAAARGASGDGALVTEASPGGDSTAAAARGASGAGGLIAEVSLDGNPRAAACGAARFAAAAVGASFCSGDGANDATCSCTHDALDEGRSAQWRDDSIDRREWQQRWEHKVCDGAKAAPAHALVLAQPPRPAQAALSDSFHSLCGGSSGGAACRHAADRDTVTARASARTLHGGGGSSDESEVFP